MMVGIKAVFAFVLASFAMPVCALEVTVDPRFCHALVKHTPDADVAYQPGVDARGKRVVPADVPNGYEDIIPKEITIPLTADLMSVLDKTSKSAPFKHMGRNDIQLGTLTVREDKVYLNDKPLTDSEQDNLAVLCLKPTKRKK